MSPPDLEISRDGRHAVEILDLVGEPYRTNRDGYNQDVAIRLRPREDACYAQVFVSGTIHFVQETCPQHVGAELSKWYAAI